MRWIVCLLLFTAASFAQEEDEDEIEIDTNPPAEEDEEPSAPDRPKKPTSQKGKKKGWLRFEDESKKYAIELPEIWSPESFDPSRGVLGCRWRLAGSETGASLALIEAKSMRDPRSAPRRPGDLAALSAVRAAGRGGLDRRPDRAPDRRALPRADP